jgi:hypothetical protein
VGGKEGENAHGKCQRATLISVGAEGAVLGEAVVKVRRDQDQAWRFNGDGGGSGQDRTHEATHNANTIACSAGGGVGGGRGSRAALREASAGSVQWIVMGQQQQAQRR